MLVMKEIKMKKRIVEVDIDKIVPYENNPRKNDKAVEVVTKSIEQTGYNNPIIVDENMVILAGHTRLKSLKKIGTKKVEVMQVEGLSDEQKRKFRLLDNKTSEYAMWDYLMLSKEIEGLDWEDLDIDWGVTIKSDVDTEFDNTEYSSEDFDDEKFEYECPECGFRFNA